VTAYYRLLDAAIGHLEGLRAEGVDFIPVKRETLAFLSKPVPVVSSTIQGKGTAPTRQGDGSVPVPRPTSSTRPEFHAEKNESPAPVRPRETAARIAVPPSAAARWNRAVGTGPEVPAPVVVPAAPHLDPSEREAAMDSLRARTLACVKCPNLASSRKSVVFGVGDIQSPLLFIGEAPGADEDLQGEPFVGKAGELLTKIIVAMGLNRDRVYIANILKCRPDTPGQSTGNRKPAAAEMATCIPWLHEQVSIIQPKAIVALGATAMEGLTGKSPVPITRVRGSWTLYRGIPLMPTYHPAYLLRNQALSEKRKVWEDMLAVMERLEMPISERQRGYFLPK
jgi:uracil-DNA glycosylase